MKHFVALKIGLIFFYYTVTLAQAEQLQRLISFTSCRYDEDCNANSFCYGNDDVNGGKCRCKENYILMDRNRTYYECIPVADGIDSPCTRDIQCQINLGVYASCSSESDGVCICRDDAHLSTDQKCHKTAALGELCDTDNNCLLGDGTYGFCVVGKCACNLNHHASEDGLKCIFTAALGKSCPNSESCIHTFAACYGGICKCIAGYIESEDNSVCLSAASTFGENCTESVQCDAYLKNSLCSNGECSCRNGHHGYGTECVLDAKLGERCSYDKECILSADIQNSVRCTSGICSCVEGTSDTNSYGCVIINGGHRVKSLATFYLATISNVTIFFIQFLYIYK